MIDKDSPIVKEFLLESQEALSSIGEELTRYEKIAHSNTDPELINSLYRKIHTLKGSASFLALNHLESLTHSVETIFDHLREGDFLPTPEMVDLLLESFDACHEILKNIEEKGIEGSEEHILLKSKLESQLEHELIKEPIKVHTYPTEVNESSTLKTESSIATEDVTKDAKNTNHEVSKRSVQTESQDKPSSTDQSQKISKGVVDSTVRVNVKLLDKILNVVGELVLNRNQILQLSKETEEPVLAKLSHQLNVITTELQTDIMTTRMQPVGAVFNKFERIVRDLARSQGKKVKLDLQGQDTELDKTLLELIKDPMTHLIRNAIDHGIENPEVRLSKGKTDTGHLSIKTYHAGGQITIEITDDGNGISIERVLQKAVSKNIMTQEEADSCSSTKALNLIFHPGFSTAEKVTNISGRGVGMDVVKSNIEKIGGQCEVHSVEGEGTVFKLKIPLTLAIIPALIVKGGGETFAIPQKNLIELVLLEDNNCSLIEKIHDSEFFRLRGDLIPIFRVNNSLGLTKELEPSDSFSIVVLQSDTGTYGLIVDEILDTQEIVVKPLSHKLKVGNIYAGATIMGDGAVALILDTQGLFNLMDEGQADSQTDNKYLEEDIKAHIDIDVEELLLFELKDKRKYGIPLCLVSRLEEFSHEQIEVSGKQKLIRYREMAMALIDVNEHVSYDNIKSLNSHDENIYPCIVSNIKGRNFGFLVDNILDIGKAESAIDYSTTTSDNLMGTTYVNGHIVTIIDIHSIIHELRLVKVDPTLENYKARILLAEDSILYQRVIQETLESNGYYVVLAENGEEAFNYINSNEKFDLVITDIEMPKMNGFDLTKKIRSLSAFKNIPIIAVTTRVSDSDLMKGKEVGITEHLKKLDQEEVLRSVKKYMTNIA